MTNEIINDSQLEDVVGGKKHETKKVTSANCPVCNGKLYKYQGEAVCPSGHVFPGGASHPSYEMLIRTDSDFANKAMKNL